MNLDYTSKKKKKKNLRQWANTCRLTILAGSQASSHALQGAREAKWSHCDSQNQNHIAVRAVLEPLVESTFLWSAHSPLTLGNFTTPRLPLNPSKLPPLHLRAYEQLLCSCHILA